MLCCSSEHRHVSGAVQPPVGAGIRRHANVQSSAGVHRVADHRRRLPGLRAFRLLPHCILHTYCQSYFQVVTGNRHTWTYFKELMNKPILAVVIQKVVRTLLGQWSTTYSQVI